MTTRRILSSFLLFLGMLNAASAQIKSIPPPSVFDELARVNLAVSRVNAKLIEVMNDTTIDDDYRQCAIDALGGLRQDEAVLPLFQHLLFKAGRVGARGPLTNFPAAQALGAYGRDLYQSLPAVFLEERSPEYVYVLACLLHTIDGKRFAIVRVEKELAADPLSAIQRQNFTRLINRLKTTDFDDLLKWPRLNLKLQVKEDVRAEPAQ